MSVLHRCWLVLGPLRIDESGNVPFMQCLARCVALWFFFSMVGLMGCLSMGWMEWPTLMAVVTKPSLWPPAGQVGYSLAELGDVLVKGAVFMLVLPTFQAFMWAVNSKHMRAEKVFFSVAICVRMAWLSSVVSYYVMGMTSDAPYRNWMLGLFFASYSADMLLIAVKPQEFKSDFKRFIIFHHTMSMAFILPWLYFVAPRGHTGAEIFNTVFVYLSAALWNHPYKLISCYWRPPWWGVLALPAFLGHWLHLSASQALYFNECPYSAWGCWYPGATLLITVAWSMAAYDVPVFVRALQSEWSRRIRASGDKAPLPAAAGAAANAGALSPVGSIQDLQPATDAPAVPASVESAPAAVTQPAAGEQAQMPLVEVLLLGALGALRAKPVRPVKPQSAAAAGAAAVAPGKVVDAPGMPQAPLVRRRRAGRIRALFT